MRYLALVMLGSLIASNAYAQDAKTTSCARVINSNVVVKKDGVYADVKVKIPGDEEKNFLIKKTKETDDFMVKIDGKNRYISYIGNNIVSIGDVCH